MSGPLKLQYMQATNVKHRQADIIINNYGTRSNSHLQFGDFGPSMGLSFLHSLLSNFASFVGLEGAGEVLIQ